MDAQQVAPQLTGVGRQALALGEQLGDLPADVRLELRCARETADMLAVAYPPTTRIVTPIPYPRPRLRRIASQQLIGPLRDGPSTLLVCLGDQGPLIGRARVLLVINDVRRLRQPETAGRVEGLYYRQLVPRAIRHADVVATVSKFTRAELAATTGCDARVIAHHPTPRTTLPARSPDDGHFLVVGALRSYKSVETAIDALALLDERERRELVLAGPTEGREPELLDRALRRGVAGHVRLAGWVGEDELERLFSTASLTINPSLYEGYGLPVAESLARGVPTVASDIPPHREIGGARGVRYFPPGDARALAEALRSLGTAAERQALAIAGVERLAALAGGEPTWRDVVLAAAGLA